MALGMSLFASFSNKVEIVGPLRAYAKRMARQLIRNAIRIEGSRPLSPFTKALKGKDTSSVSAAAVGVPIQIQKRTVTIGHQGKSGGRKGHRILMAGSGLREITPRQTLKLRSMGVRAGLFSIQVLSVPVHLPPFAAGRKKLQPSRNPVYMLGESEVEQAAEDVVDQALKDWGFV